MWRPKNRIPFAHQIKIHGPQGEIVRVSALFDGVVMVAAMCVTLFNVVKHWLGHWQPSQKQLHMANRVIIPSQAWWEGTIQLLNVTIKGTFEVFDSGGSWAFLLGKPLLWQLRAKQNFETWHKRCQSHSGCQAMQPDSQNYQQKTHNWSRGGWLHTANIRDEDRQLGDHSTHSRHWPI